MFSGADWTSLPTGRSHGPGATGTLGLGAACRRRRDAEGGTGGIRGQVHGRAQLSSADGSLLPGTRSGREAVDMTRYRRSRLAGLSASSKTLRRARRAAA